MLNALGSVLRLDDDARSHLFRLAGLAPRPAQPSPERADPELLQLLDGWPNNPALVLGRAYDVLAGNRLGYALFEEFRGGANLLVKLFLDPDARSFYKDWQAAAVNTVAGFRLLHGQDPHHPRIREVLASMLEHSPEFVELWRRNEARGKRAEVKTFRHRDVGELTLRMHAFDVRAAPGQQLVVYHAEPGSASQCDKCGPPPSIAKVSRGKLRSTGGVDDGSPRSAAQARFHQIICQSAAKTAAAAALPNRLRRRRRPGGMWSEISVPEGGTRPASR